MNRKIVMMWAACLALGAACVLPPGGEDGDGEEGGDGGGGSGPGSSTPIPLDRFGAEVAAAYCAKVFSCCTDEEIREEFESWTPPVRTEQDCVRAMQAFFEQYFLPEIQASVAAGRARYHADRAGACRDAFQRLSCTQYATRGDDDIDGCESFLEGLVPQGGECSGFADCVEGTSCYQEWGPDGPTGTGTCQPDEDGDRCGDEVCGADAYCGYHPQTFDPICMPRRSNGATCEWDGECRSDHCNIGNAEEGICADRPIRCDGR